MNAMQKTLMPVTVMLALAMSAGPLLAQSNEGQRRRSDRGAAASANRGGDGNASRQARPRDGQRAERPSAWSGRRSNESANAQRNTAPRREYRAEAPRRNEARGNNSRAYDSRNYDRRAYDARAYDGRRYDAPRNAPQRYSNAYAVPRGSRSYVYGPPRYRDYRYDGRYYYGSWYSRRPFVAGGYYSAYRPGWNVRFGLGYSVYAGSPFAFRFSYGYAPGYGYPYAVRAGVAYGGMSFLVDPDETEVYVDGVFIGHARQFGGQPVPITAGYHRVELYAPGFEGVVFDVNVMPGQVIPYRGSLVPAYNQ